MTGVKELYNDVPLSVWKKVLDENMNYNFGTDFFSKEPFNNFKTVLEIGCGWGANIKSLKNMYGTKVTGVTSSEQQAKYLNDENIILADAENFNPTEKYDCTMFIQSSSHMLEDAFINGSKASDKIFISDFLLKNSENSIFLKEWIMTFRTEKDYKNIFEKIGFNIKYLKSKPLSQFSENFSSLLKNIKNNKFVKDYQMELLENLCENFLGFLSSDNDFSIKKCKDCNDFDCKTECGFFSNLHIVEIYGERIK
tara:strand:- start:584 stop:1342 length:759 start_codon:yes stop_codon:yes gene_type:complete